MLKRLPALLVCLALLAPASARAEEEARSARVVKLLYVMVGPAVAALAAGSATAGGLDDVDDRATMDTAIRTASGHLQLTAGILHARPLTLNHSVALAIGGALDLDRLIPVE